MGSRRILAALVAVFVCAALAASAGLGASFTVMVRHTPNLTPANRTARTIDGIVIHATEGHFIGSVRWLQEARSQGSAHFVVSRRGTIVQLVPVRDVAWHSGNNWWNLHSIGIEHEGWTSRGGFTEPEYHASAKLVAYLAHRWGIPLNRRHIIGHYQVPNPFWPGHFGGVDGHRDPGPHWHWAHYMSLVRADSKDPVRPQFVRPTAPRAPKPSTVLVSKRTRPAGAPHRPGVRPHARLHDTVHWAAGIDAAHLVPYHIHRVDFLVDGRVLYSDHVWPFAFNRGRGWNTRTVLNGSHMLVVHAFGTHGYRLRKRIPVRVVNPPLPLTVTGVASGDAVSGQLQLGVAVGAGGAKVSLSVDGRELSRDLSAPFRVSWDTLSASEGPHDLVVTARDRFGHRVSERLGVVVANAPSFPSLLAGGTELPDLHASVFSRGALPE
jgi:N-acetyl-anhydromuramyl-L-alanine amidase AmpD